MCHHGCIKFAERIPQEEIRNKLVLEVGSINVNGTCADWFKRANPRDYIGVDLSFGKNVDQVVAVEDLVHTFGCDSFDIVLSTEMLEHVRDWKTAIYNMTSVLKIGGYLLITTRSKGFSRHGFPEDHWRFSVEDMEKIFQNYQQIAIENDPIAPGVLVLVKKLADTSDLFLWEDIHPYSMDS